MLVQICMIDSLSLFVLQTELNEDQLTFNFAGTAVKFHHRLDKQGSQSALCRHLTIV